MLSIKSEHIQILVSMGSPGTSLQEYLWMTIVMDKKNQVNWKASTSGTNRVANSTNTLAKDYLQSWMKYFLNLFDDTGH